MLSPLAITTYPFPCVAARERSRQLHDVILIRKGQQGGGSSQDIFKNFLNLRLQNTNLEVDLQHIHFHLRIPNATVRRKYHVSPIIECFFSFCAKFVEIDSILGQNFSESRIPIFSWGKSMLGSRLVIGGDATDAAESAMWRCGLLGKRERGISLSSLRLAPFLFFFPFKVATGCLDVTLEYET